MLIIPRHLGLISLSNNKQRRNKLFIISVFLLTLTSVQDTTLPSDEMEQKLRLLSMSSFCQRTWHTETHKCVWFLLSPPTIISLRNCISENMSEQPAGQPPHLPHWTCVFAGSHWALVHWLGPLLLQVVDGHAAVVETHGHQVGELLVDVQAQDARGGAVDELWEGGVLQRVKDQHALALFVEVVWTGESWGGRERMIGTWGRETHG